VKKASITETKNNLSALIDRVKHGETVVIVDRGRPVAKLDSIVASAQDDGDGRLARLERAGIITRARVAAPRDLLSRRPPRARKGASISRVLRDEREDGR
jgi:prevent-host-death family protein